MTRLISFVLFLDVARLNGLKNNLSKTKMGQLRFEIIANRGQIKTGQWGKKAVQRDFLSG